MEFCASALIRHQHVKGNHTLQYLRASGCRVGLIDGNSGASAVIRKVKFKKGAFENEEGSQGPILGRWELGAIGSTCYVPGVWCFLRLSKKAALGIRPLKP